MKIIRFIVLAMAIFWMHGCAKHTEKITPRKADKRVNINHSTIDISATANDSFEEEFAQEEMMATSDNFDPLEGYNRIMTKFNDKLYLNILDPLAKNYAYIVPEGVRVSLKRGFKNIQSPVSIANNLLQLKFKNAFDESHRFVVNTLFGLGGLFDPAKSHLGLESCEEDFGQTLGHYQVGDGIQIVLPFLGPSNLRDFVGEIVDGYVDPFNNLKVTNTNYKIANTTTETFLYQGGDIFNKASLHIGEYQMIKKDAIDLYPYLQDIYSQHRNQQIKE